jgi:hypothetical protein
MTTPPTYAQIAEDIDLWHELVDTEAFMSTTEFYAMSHPERVQLIIDFNGPEPHPQ